MGVAEMTENWNDLNWGASYKKYHERYPNKLIVVSEYGQTNTTPNRTENCRNWLEELRNHPEVKLACYFGVEMIGWDIEDADNNLLVNLASIKPLEGGQTMTWDRRTEFDAWQKALGGLGYNPKDAFGKIISDNPDKQYGVFIGPYHFADDLILAWTTVGIFWYRKSDQKAGFASNEEQLPLA